MPKRNIVSIRAQNQVGLRDSSRNDSGGSRQRLWRETTNIDSFLKEGYRGGGKQLDAEVVERHVVGGVSWVEDTLLAPLLAITMTKTSKKIEKSSKQ